MEGKEKVLMSKKTGLGWRREGEVVAGAGGGGGA